MKPSYLIILLIMNFFWAAIYSAYKVVGQSLATGGIVTLRFGLAALSLLFIWPWLPGKPPRGKALAATAGLGVLLYVVGHRLQVYGNHLGSAGNSAVLMGFEPLTTTAIAALVLGERIGPRRWAGFALGICGVAFLHRVWRPDFKWTGLGASLIFVSSFVCEAFYSVLGKPIVARAGVMKMLAVSLLAGTLVNLLIDGSGTLQAVRTLGPKAWGLLMFLAIVCTAIGYTVWFVIIRECPVNLAALTVFAQSVFGVAIAAVWLGERFYWEQLVGSLIIVSGLVVGLSRQIKKPEPSQ